MIAFQGEQATNQNGTGLEDGNHDQNRYSLA